MYGMGWKGFQVSRGKEVSSYKFQVKKKLNPWNSKSEFELRTWNLKPGT
jgi:hypothetical protein